MSDSTERSPGEERRGPGPHSLRVRALGCSITADDIARSEKFYAEGLGFTVKKRWEHEGKLIGVELVAGNAFIWLMQDNWAKGRDRTKGVGLRIFAETTQDIDELAQRFRDNGIEVEGPADQGGSRAISVSDPDGFNISFFSPRE